MESRGSGKLNFRELARNLGISPMTIYRVINDYPYVREQTRTRVIDALQQFGYFTYAQQVNRRILFDFTDHPYLTHYGKILMQKMQKLNYACIATNHQINRREFLLQVSKCNTAVMVSIPDDDLIAQMRKINSDIYIITLSTKSNSDVTIAPDHVLGGELAARHFFNNGHHHIAVHMSERHPNRFLRYGAFLANMQLLDPKCRIDSIIEKKDELTANVIRKYLKQVDTSPTGILFLAGEFAENYCQNFLPTADQKYKDISVLTFDNPNDLEFRILHYDFDRIEFHSRDLIDWAGYYITNRPLMKKRAPISTSINVRLITTGSVKNLNRTSSL